MDAFLETWDSALDNMEERPSDKTLEHLFTIQIRKSTIMKDTIGVYDRADVGSKKRCMEWVRKERGNNPVGRPDN